MTFSWRGFFGSADLVARICAGSDSLELLGPTALLPFCPSSNQNPLAALMSTILKENNYQSMFSSKQKHRKTNLWQRPLTTSVVPASFRLDIESLSETGKTNLAQLFQKYWENLPLLKICCCAEKKRVAKQTSKSEVHFLTSLPPQTQRHSF